MKVFELKLEDLNLQGIFKISLVNNPAIESNYITLNKQFVLAKTDSDKKMLVGAAMIPNKQILRIEETTQEEYMIWFAPETIEAAAHEYITASRHGQVNIEHSVDVGGVHTVESWIVADAKNDKANALGFDVPVGTWMIAMKVSNDQVWDDLIKTGMVKGFSIEGFFTPTEDAEELALLSQIRELLSNLS